MHSVIMISPFRCRMWDLHSRVEQEISEKTCKSEIESFAKHGQLVPVLGRKLKEDRLHDVELVYGARRLFVARHLNMDLKVELRVLSDLDALVAMDIENRHRKDISPYERGLSYLQWLRSGLFKSQDELARAMSISAPQVSRLLRLARLPSVVIDAFESPASICEAWGLRLAEAVHDPHRRRATIESARRLAAESPRHEARAVYRSLVTAAISGRALKRAIRDEVVRDWSGEPLFCIRQQAKSIAVLLPFENVSAQALTDIRAAITDILARDSHGVRVDKKSLRRINSPQPVDYCASK